MARPSLSSAVQTAFRALKQQRKRQSATPVPIQQLNWMLARLLSQFISSHLSPKESPSAISSIWLRDHDCFRYFRLEANVQIFSSIDDNWTDGQVNLQLDHQVTGNTSMLNLTDPSEMLYAKNEDMAAWGSVILATTENNASSLIYQSSSTITLYSEFVNDGELRGETPPY